MYIIRLATFKNEPFKAFKFTIYQLDVFILKFMAHRSYYHCYYHTEPSNCSEPYIAITALSIVLEDTKYKLLVYFRYFITVEEHSICLS